MKDAEFDHLTLNCVAGYYTVSANPSKDVIQDPIGSAYILPTNNITTIQSPVDIH